MPGGPATGEYEEKKSKFIANLAVATTEEEAASFIASIKKKYYDARHNCTAFIIGNDSSLARCSDDGEPSGTAGKPMLEVLQGSGLTNVVAVVTRYFGGTLLGTGGLVRAYTEAVKNALANAQIVSMQLCSDLDVTCAYTDVNNLQHYYGSNNIMILGCDYGENVVFHLRVDSARSEELRLALTRLTKGQAKITDIGTGFYPMEIKV